MFDLTATRSPVQGRSTLEFFGLLSLGSSANQQGPKASKSGVKSPVSQAKSAQPKTFKPR